MKISNLSQIKIVGYVITTFNFIVTIGFWGFENWMWKFIFLLFFVTSLLIIINLRSIEIENSGACFSLRKSHPFAQNKYVPYRLEFPLSFINEVDIIEGVFVSYIYIKIQVDHSEKKVIIKLPFFSRQQMVNVRKLFEDTES